MTATGTREKGAAGSQASSADMDQAWSSLLTGGLSEVEGDPLGDGGPGADELGDELADVDDGASEDEDDGEGEDGEDAGGDAEGDDDGDAETDGDASPAAADSEADAYVATWADRVRAKPARIMEVPANRRAAVLTGALVAERKAATEALRDPIQRTVEQAALMAYRQGYQDAAEAVNGDAEFEEVRDLAENDLQAFGQLAHTEEGQAKVRRYLERLEQQRNPETQAAPALQAAAAKLMTKVRANPKVLSILQEKERGDRGRYAPTADGLAALQEDYAEALASVRAEEASKASEPDRKAVRDRKDAAAHRQTVVRTAGGEGRSGTPGGAAAGLPEDYMDVLGRGFAEAKKRK